MLQKDISIHYEILGKYCRLFMDTYRGSKKYKLLGRERARDKAFALL